MAWYKTVMLCLQQMFLTHKEECGDTVDQTSSDWADLRVREKEIWTFIGDAVFQCLYFYRTWLGGLD